MKTHRRLFAITMAIIVLNVLPFSEQVNAATKAAHSPKTPHVIPDSGVLDAADLVAIAKLASKASTDQFSDDPSLKYVGRDFSIVISPDQLTTSYDKVAHTLTVETATWMDAFILGGDTTESRYVGQNGFGASATITKRRGNSYGIEIPGNSYSRKPITFEANLDGDEARTLSTNIRLRLYGTIRKSSGVYATSNSIISEKSLITDATIADPDDIWIKQYLIAVDFQKAEWIDARTAAVIKSEDF